VPAERSPLPQHSLGLPALLDGLPADARPAILDLGPAVGVNIDFWSGLGCRLHVADLQDSLHAATPSWSEPEGDTALLPAGILPVSSTFDLVLAWDLLNYLTLPQMRAVARGLAPCTRRGTMLFALIGTLRQMPPRPLRYRIAGRDRLLYEDGPAVAPRAAEATRPCPRYRQPDLERGLPLFAVATSYLLRTGVQEYIFARR
jgi:hypothetical protein